MTNNSVVVIGAAHVDILADYEDSESGRLDKVGQLSYSIGGTAYNIATNLSLHYVETSIVTVLKDDSLFSDLIEKRFKENNIDTEFVERAELMPESGFIGIRCEGELVDAVTASGITEVRLNKDTLQRAVNESCVVIAECNLNKNQLAMISQVAANFEKPLFINGVSESKAKRVRAARDVDVFTLSRNEASHLFGFDPIEQPTERVFKKMNQWQIRTLVVTNDTDGYIVFEDDIKQTYPAPDIDTVVSESGAADALIAALAHEYADTGVIDWTSAQNRIERYVSDVLSQDGATPGAMTDHSERSLRARFDHALSKNVSQVNELRDRYEWIDAAAAMLSFVAALITLITLFL